jgi:peptidoglycan/LPS O-acetylase OafA/YrhL
MSGVSPQPSPPRIRELDALRGIAAMMVVLYHFITGYPILMPGVSRLPVGFEIGQHGVELFFAISGFVIFMTLENTRTASDFIVSRFSRLYPTYWACMAITIGVTQMMGPASLQTGMSNSIINLTMLPSIFKIPLVDPSYWSLVVELLFYAWMLLIWRQNALKHIEWILIFWILVRFISWQPNGQHDEDTSLLIQIHIAYFAIGIISYRVWSGARKWRDQLLIVFTAFVSFTLIKTPHQIYVNIAIFIVMVLLSKRKLNWLCQPPLLWLGAISYPLYLVHQFVGYAIMAKLETMGLPVSMNIFIALGAVLLLATLVHHLIEKPSLAWVRRIWHAYKLHGAQIQLAA